MAPSSSCSTRLPVLERGRTSLREVLDFSALKTPKFLAMTLVPAAGAIGFVTFLTYLPSALGAIHDLPPGPTGALMLVMTVPVLVAPTIAHRLLERTRATPAGVVRASFACLVVGGAGVAFLLRPEVPVL